MTSGELRPGPVIDAADGPLADAVVGRTSAAAAAASARSLVRVLISSPFDGWLRYTAPPPAVPRLGAGAGGRPDERDLEIGDEVVGRLESDGEPDQIPRCRERRVGGRGVRHARGMLDQALDAAERLGELEDLRASDQVNRFLFRLDEKRDHPPEVAHLP